MNKYIKVGLTGILAFIFIFILIKDIRHIGNDLVKKNEVRVEGPVNKTRNLIPTIDINDKEEFMNANIIMFTLENEPNYYINENKMTIEEFYGGNPSEAKYNFYETKTTMESKSIGYRYNETEPVIEEKVSSREGLESEYSYLIHITPIVSNEDPMNKLVAVKDNNSFKLYEIEGGELIEK